MHSFTDGIRRNLSQSAPYTFEFHNLGVSRKTLGRRVICTKSYEQRFGRLPERPTPSGHGYADRIGHREGSTMVRGRPEWDVVCTSFGAKPEVDLAGRSGYNVRVRPLWRVRQEEAHQGKRAHHLHQAARQTITAAAVTLR